MGDIGIIIRSRDQVAFSKNRTRINIRPQHLVQRPNEDSISNIQRNYTKCFGRCMSEYNSLYFKVWKYVVQLSSPRSSSEVKTRALEMLEQLLAFACVSKDSSENLHNFTALQYTFECNGLCVSFSTRYADMMVFQYLRDYWRGSAHLLWPWRS